MLWCRRHCLSCSIKYRPREVKAEDSEQVFERSQFKDEVGAAITITPNATRVLDHWSFDYAITGAVENRQVGATFGPALQFDCCQSLFISPPVAAMRMGYLNAPSLVADSK